MGKAPHPVLLLGEGTLNKGRCFHFNRTGARVAFADIGLFKIWGVNMDLGRLLWLVAIVIAVLVGLSYFASISVPVVTALLMKDSTLSLFVALGLALLSKLV
jgi:hypothetical protein